MALVTRPDWSQPNVGAGEDWYNAHYPKTAVDDIGVDTALDMPAVYP